MLLQKGKFLINNAEELNQVIPDSKDNIKRVIDLDYMGKLEYEGNTIPVLRILIEYYKDEYQFYNLDIFNQNGEQMIMYVNFENQNNHKENLAICQRVAKQDIERNYSLYQHIKNTNDSYNDFWWNIDYNYMIIFGEEKKELIRYFVESCYNRDGGKEGIVKKLKKVGYKLD